MRVLVVEDDVPLAGVLRQGLEARGYAVDAVNTRRVADDCLAPKVFDIVILDLGLPDGDGLQLLRSIRRNGSPLPVLILTARDAPDDRVLGLDAGADDYLGKPFYFPELTSRLRALLRRPEQTVFPLLEAGNVAFDPASRQATAGGRAIALTSREAALLELLLRQENRVITRDRIEAALYNFETVLGSNAVDVLVHRLRAKLHAAGATADIHTLRGVGYLLQPPS